MTPQPFVPADFDPPASLATERFRLQPLGERHNEADHAAWTSSIAHIRSTPGYPDGSWPPLEGMSLEDNARDLRRHDADFAARKGFTFTVQSWVRADRAELDVPLAEAVAAWLETDWPWERPDRCGR